MIGIRNHPIRGRRWSAVLGVLWLAAAAAACDVTNPGNILDADLNDPAAMPALVNGMASDFSDALMDAAPITGGLFGDLFNSTSSTGLPLFARQGILPESRPQLYNGLTELHKVRWVADDGIRRMKEVLGEEYSTSAVAAEANMWGGFAYRLSGDTWCRAVIPGQGLQPREAYYERAEQHFSNAIAIADAAGATDILYAALGGRASVRIILGDWAGAVADARRVPSGFAWYAKYNSSAQGNRLTNVLWKEMQDRRNMSVTFTWFRDYYLETQDPRVPSYDTGHIGGDGSTPLIAQDKYPEGTADVALTKGTEMRLIEAEYLIRQGQWQAGLDMINTLRQAAGVSPWTASNREEAFDALVKERAIVLWLEARRGGDIFRWGVASQDDPIQSTMVENAQTMWPEIQLQNRSTCVPIDEITRITNPELF